MIKAYCTQNHGDCETCSMVNYGLDCRNNPVGKGGPGRGQGRKPTGRKKHNYYVTPEEDVEIRKFIERMRSGHD